MKTAVKRLARSAGFEIRPYDARLDAQISKFLQARRITHVIDIGANIGQFSTFMRQSVGFLGRIDALEPVPDSYSRLTEAFVGDEEWYGHNVAAASRPDVVQMNIFHDSVLNSIHQTTAAGSAVFAQPVLRQAMVTALPLDQVDLPDLGPTFLKVDTQGHDWEVLMGATETLRRVEMLSMELSFEAMYDGSVPAWESMQRLHDLGFGLAAIDTNVCPATDGLRVGEADGYFLRR